MIPAGHDWLDVAAVITALVLAIGGLGAIFRLITERDKYKAQSRKIDADTAETYQKIADLAAQRALKLEERLQHLENLLDAKDVRIEDLEKAGALKDARILDLQREVADLKCKVQVLEREKKI